MRINRHDLNYMCTRIHSATCDEAYYVSGEPGGFVLRHGVPAYQEGRDVFRVGVIPASVMYYMMHSFLTGLETGRNLWGAE